ncbi:MAG: carbamoyltransferase HypF [Runella sp.]
MRFKYKMPPIVCETFEIRLQGLVQGVGFRPFVYQLATDWGLKGTVSNGPEGVRVLVNTNKPTAESFLENILQNAPPLSQVVRTRINLVPFQNFDSFEISESEVSDSFSLLLPPDFSVCRQCLNELHDPANRRYRYPFITCTRCGPRYSIITALPYDRPQTSMAGFRQCASCQCEYQNPSERRFFAQTNSCESCGPRLNWYKYERKGFREISKLYDARWILPRVKWALEQGKIVAVKGIGGYLLLCDATNPEAVETLRRRKHRPTKPFAVLYPSLGILQKEVVLRDAETQALLSEVAPIVLAERLAECQVARNVAPSLAQIGVMLPYTPLLELIAHDFGKPLVATSGNVSGNPIVFEDEKALADFGGVADYVLGNNRPILIPQDDSVVRFSPKHQHKIIVRRSRGMSLHLLEAPQNVEFRLAMGASMKATFAVNTPDYLYVSQYLGDLESYETQQNYEQVLSHFLRLLNPSKKNLFEGITQICYDAHEGYFSTQMAQQIAHKYQIPSRKVQHHLAHLAAVLSENQLLENRKPTLGVVWDGTGYGTDGQIWGGEFFVLNNSHQTLAQQLQQPPQRLHFDYFEALLGDKMPREPRLSALSFCKGVVDSKSLLQAKFNPTEWQLYTKLLQNNFLKTSSLGRIFDAVASLLGLIDKATYEGEAALLLENLATRYFKKNSGYDFKEWYLQDAEFVSTIPTSQLADEITKDLLAGLPNDRIAAKFHVTLAKMIEKIAMQHQVRQIAFSGGVFQNVLLVDLIIGHLSRNFTLYFHQSLSPNDECIAYGQMVLGSLNEK